MAVPYGFAYVKPALDNLESIPKKFRRQIVRKIESLAGNPHPKGVKPVQGSTDGDNPIYRLRSGDYRILYCVRDAQTIVILDIGNRKDIYRRSR